MNSFNKTAKQILQEAKPSQAFDLLSKIGKLVGYRRISAYSQADGYAILLRDDITGQAYEVQIRPAAYGQHPAINQNFGAGKGTAR